ncbi:Glyoxysomal fatty acid beta-oxidation multifunctional protein MFP-a [Hordeum vulgare]|nr:Glyoxysomal fatty acid beta-oxidation multifunctional protein MFP-a [Hordeum vulgare]
MAAKGTTEMEVGGDGVAVITICNPPVNSLSIDVLLSLKESYEEALQRKDVKAIVVTGTQRLPRLVGLTKSLEMVLLSKPIKGEEAHQLGLVDALVSPNDLNFGFTSVMYMQEANAFQGLLFSDTCKSLLQVPGATDLGLMPRKIMKVAILGGVLMGSGIATAMILSNYPVLLKEAVIENVKLKQQTFADLEKYCPSHCILATNTSTIDLNLIGEKTKSQDRIVGAHFFCPAHVMPLLEIVRTQHTSAQVVVDLLDVGKRIKKTPIVVGNCTGFAVNRMFFPYTQSALLLVDYVMNVYKIDRACTKFGMPMGPFRLADLVGFGVAVATGMQYLENFLDRVYKSMLIPIMMEDKRAGEGSRKVFYKYEDKRKATPDPEIMTYIQKSRSMAGVTPDAELMKLSDKDIVEMVFFPVINEACRVLDEGIAVKASDLDIASIFGMGFPPYRGGVMLWGDSIGAKYIHEKLQLWAKRYDSFFEPCSYLAERAAKGIPLSAPAASQVKARL